MLLKSVASRLMYNSTVQRLRMMTDSQLNDIGISRKDIARAVSGAMSQKEIMSRN